MKQSVRLAHSLSIVLPATPARGAAAKVSNCHIVATWQFADSFSYLGLIALTSETIIHKAPVLSSYRCRQMERLAGVSTGIMAAHAHGAPPATEQTLTWPLLNRLVVSSLETWLRGSWDLTPPDQQRTGRFEIPDRLRSSSVNFSASASGREIRKREITAEHRQPRFHLASSANRPR
ncbi:hypothetical protein G7046_g9418 [Stylonectria norvegica]|nr:hypothetical protein G7046_g9418 [Stylonectria norvegica]